MPYEGEFAKHRSLQRIAESPRVQELLRLARTVPADAIAAVPNPQRAPTFEGSLPSVAIAIDGSWLEIPVRNGYPGAAVGYCTIATVLIKLAEVDILDRDRPIDPIAFRRTQDTASLDEALPGANVVVGASHSARDSFRTALYEALLKNVPDADDGVSLLDTYESLLTLKPTTHPQVCPYVVEGCVEQLNIRAGIAACSRFPNRPIYSTDALRIHEGFHGEGSNGELFGEVVQVWERLFLVHLIRVFERRGFLSALTEIAFFVDGPLAVFGHPAWMSAAISRELKRVGALVRDAADKDLLILGIEKAGAFVTHFDEIDRTAEPGQDLFARGSYLLLTDAYIKERVNYSTSTKRYGVDTYFGRKFFYKTSRGGRVVASLPFLSDAQDTIETDDVGLYPRFGEACAVLDRLVSSMYPNALAPIVAAHAEAAIPLNLGRKVLEQLARALVREA